MESVLELAMRCWQPYRRLLWHYRSRHGSLIAFSNHMFYDGELIVFPAPVDADAPDHGVKFERVDGAYKKGTNVPEAKRVAEEAVALMGAERRRGDEPRSLGVVAMNRMQTELIQAEADRLVQRDPDAYAYTEHFEQARGGLEPFFVKNLQNVQGDQRDVIYISGTYGPDADTGKVKQHFGPINRDVGYRRLNVLFTRAKQQVRLFASLDAEQVRVDETGTSFGRRAFRDYLSYAATGYLPGDPAAAGVGGEPDSDFESFVKQRLEEYGFRVDCQVGVSGYFTDLGVRHDAFPAGYVAGVECDGATYHSAKSTRDRDRLRQEVLEALGWDIVRVWSTDSFSDPDRETEKLIAHLRAILERKAPAAMADRNNVVRIGTAGGG